MAVTLKKGILQKRSQGKSAIGQLLPNWQNRLFVLTEGLTLLLLLTLDTLTYYDEAGKEAKDTIPLVHILGVEAVTVSGFLKPNVFQVPSGACVLTCRFSFRGPFCMCTASQRKTTTSGSCFFESR